MEIETLKKMTQQQGRSFASDLSASDGRLFSLIEGQVSELVSKMPKGTALDDAWRQVDARLQTVLAQEFHNLSRFAAFSLLRDELGARKTS
jgi:hypothetical protein